MGDARTQQSVADVQAFLERFGYLEAGRYRPGVLDAATAAALATYQRFFGLAVTGEPTPETLHDMSLPRCGLPDPATSPVAYEAKCPWKATTLTFRFGALSSGTAKDPDEAVRRAFMTWSSVVALTFLELPPTTRESVHIEVAWVPAADRHHSMVGPVVAHADWPPGCDYVQTWLPKPLHFDDDEHTWSTAAQPASTAFDVETVALHELGHLIGLGHSDVKGAAVMQSKMSVQGQTRRVLGFDDLNGAQSLYPSCSVQSGWRHCPKCRGMFFGGNASQGSCPAGGAHAKETAGYEYRLHNAAGAPGEAGWRWCGKCQGLFRAGAGAVGVCPAGGGHSLSGGEYALLTQLPNAVGQHGWHLCTDCRGLFQGTTSAGVCPAGGTHAFSAPDYRAMYL